MSYNIPRHIKYIPQISPSAPAGEQPVGEQPVGNPVVEYIFNPSDLDSSNDPITKISIDADLSNYVSELGGSTVLGDITIGDSAGLIFDY